MTKKHLQEKLHRYKIRALQTRRVKQPG